MKSKPVYERGRVLHSLFSNRFFFCEKVRVLPNGLRQVVGKKHDVTDDLQPYLKPGLLAYDPLAPERGPVATELRAGNRTARSGPAHLVWCGALAELTRRRGMRKPAYEDVMSEAIEAAEALGL